VLVFGFCFAEDIEDVAAFVTSSAPSFEKDASDASDDDASDPDRREVLQELWSSNCRCDLFTALKGVDVCLRLFAEHLDRPGAVANLGPVAASEDELQGVFLVFEQAPRVMDRRWGAGAADAFADEADRLYITRHRVTYF
jgi:hypothetical protein